MRFVRPPITTILISTCLLTAADAKAQQITLVAGGDVEWSRIVRVPDVYWDPPEAEEGAWHRLPYLNVPKSRDQLESRGHLLDSPDSHHLVAIRYELEFDDPVAMARHPFRKIAPVLREADIAYVNLENPLSDRARRSGAFRAPAIFAEGLRWAGIDVVSTANNHALDAEGEGLLDTKEALWHSGVAAVGTGTNLEDARRPFITEVEGVSIALLAYAAYSNAGTSAFALPDRAGMVPLDPVLIAEDIARVRDQVDHVILSFHWGIENTRELHPQAQEFARRIIDAGADIILGHGPHLPRGVEIYDGGVIVYSMGNLIFGHNHDYWDDNFMTRLTLEPDRVAKVEILPIAGRGTGLSQPYQLEGQPAKRVLSEIQLASQALGTYMEIQGDLGVIQP